LVVIGPPGAEALASRALVAGASAYEGSCLTPLGLLRAIQAAAGGRLHLNNTGRRAAQKLTRRALGDPD
jgi:DNA-binding NarL/FixJ family response regulator